MRIKEGAPIGNRNAAKDYVSLGDKIDSDGLPKGMEVVKVHGKDVWLKTSDGKTIGPFDAPQSPYKKG